MSETNPSTVITITRHKAKVSYDVAEGLVRWEIIEFEEEKGGGVDMDKEQKEWMKNHTKADLAMQVINSQKALQRKVNTVIRLERENLLLGELRNDIAKSATLMKAAARTINNLQFELKGVNEDNTALLVELEEARKARDFAVDKGHKVGKDWWENSKIEDYKFGKDIPF